MLNASKKKFSGLIANLKERIKHLPDQYAIVREKMQDLTKTNTELGFRHLELGNISDAVMRFKMVLRWFSQDYPPALYGLGACRKEEGDYQEATKLLRRAIELNNGSYPEAEYVLAQIDSSITPNTIPLSTVKQYFDTIAPTFNEDFLGNRHYRGPEMVLEAVTTVLKDRSDLTMLDIGCGTGLCGKEFKEQKLATEITGIDISNAMLQQAQALKVNYRPVYDTVLEQDYMEYLASNPTQKFDVIMAAIAFHYHRNLSEVLSACKKLLQPGGVIVFTACKSEQKEIEFQPQNNTYAFSLTYLNTQAQKAGLTSVLLKEILIYEGCPGYICTFVNT